MKNNIEDNIADQGSAIRIEAKYNSEKYIKVIN